MNDFDPREGLRRWDPAREAEPPAEELRLRIRSRLAGAEEPDWVAKKTAWPWPPSVLAAGAAAAALLIALVVFFQLRPGDSDGARSAEVASGPGGSAPAAAVLEAEPVRMVYTASNGVRVYWSVVPTSDSGI